MANNLNVRKALSKEFVREEPFETTVRRWAHEANYQLRDAARIQRLFRSNSDKSHEVWRRNKKRTVLQFSRPDKYGHRHVIGRREYASWGWLDENALREKKQQEHPNSTYWFSTGDSIDRTNVTVDNLLDNPNEFLIRGDVTFRTTLQMYFAERGVGKNGPNHIRGRDIHINSEDPFSWRYRYVNEWLPGQGDSHRPFVRQRVHYMAKRMRWLAKQNFTLTLNTWLTVSLRSILEDKKIYTPYGTLSLSSE